MSEKRIWYRAVCKACGETMQTSHDPRWLSPFFLPADCVDCGAHHNRYTSFGPADSEIETIREEFITQPRKLFQPSTWFGKWMRIEAESPSPPKADRK